MTAQVSYGVTHKIRHVDVVFDTLLKNSTSLLSMFPLTGGELLTNTKHEWLNDQLSPVESTIGSFDTDGDGTGVNLASTAGIIAGSILRFSTAADVTRTELVKVVSVDSATDLTVVRDYAGTTGVTLVVGDKVFLISSPKSEGSGVGAGEFHESTADFNYTEIFDEVAEVTGTTEALATYDDYNKLYKQELVAMKRMAYKLENALIHGVKLIRSSGVPGTMGGLLSFINAAGGNIVAAGGPISTTIINNALEEMFKEGANNMEYALMCNTNQARRITALNSAGANPIMQKSDTPSQRIGTYVSNFVGDIPMMKGTYTGRVFANLNMPKDQILILDMSRIKFKVLRRMKSMNAAQNGEDVMRRRLLTELTLEIKNAKQAHAVITGATV